MSVSVVCCRCVDDMDPRLVQKLRGRFSSQNLYFRPKYEYWKKRYFENCLKSTHIFGQKSQVFSIMWGFIFMHEFMSLWVKTRAIGSIWGHNLDPRNTLQHIHLGARGWAAFARKEMLLTPFLANVTQPQPLDGFNESCSKCCTFYAVHFEPVFDNVAWKESRK